MNYANIAKTFYMQEQLDSALHYNQSPSKRTNPSSPTSAPHLQESDRQIYLKQGKTRLGLGLIKEAANLLATRRMRTTARKWRFPTAVPSCRTAGWTRLKHI